MSPLFPSKISILFIKNTFAHLAENVVTPAIGFTIRTVCEYTSILRSLISPFLYFSFAKARDVKISPTQLPIKSHETYMRCNIIVSETRMVYNSF